MKKYFLIIILISSKSFCQSPLVEYNNKNRAKTPEEFVNVSILQLISNPEKYDGKLINVKGFIKIEFEGTAIYLHQEDYKHNISKNSIWLNLSKDTLYTLASEASDKYGSVIGIFKAEQKGHFGMFSGTITEIRGIYPEDYFMKD